MNFKSIELKKIFLLTGMLSLVVLWLVPNFTYQYNAKEFTTLNPQLFVRDSAFLAFTGFVMLSAISIILSIANKKVVIFVLVFSVSWAVIAGLFLPVVASVGQIEEFDEIPVSALNLFIVSAVSIVMASLYSSPKFELIKWVLPLIVIANLVFVIFNNVFSNNNFSLPDGNLGSLSQEKNVIVLSFDGLTRDVVLAAVDRESLYQNTFKDFLFYRNVIANAPATRSSILAELTGDQLAGEKFESEKDRNKNLSADDLLTNFIDSKTSFQASTLGAYTFKFKERRRAYQLGTVSKMLLESKQLEQTGMAFKFAFSRMFTGYFVPTSSWINKIGGMIGYSEETDESSKITHDLTKSIFDFREFEKSLDSKAKFPQALFMHFTFTHYPIELDKDCNYLGAKAMRKKGMQNELGAEGELTCALYQMSLLIDRLKALGIYDQTLIVLKSDHGKPFKYHNPLSLLGRPIDGHKKFGYARYTPFLAIKDFGQAQEKPSFDMTPVALSDLAQSICTKVVVENSTSCSQFEKEGGVNLFDRSMGAQENSYYGILQLRKNSTWQLEDLDTVILPRESNFVQAYHLKRLRSRDISNLPCGKKASYLTWKLVKESLANNQNGVSYWNNEKSFNVTYGVSECDNSELILEFSENKDHLDLLNLNYSVEGEKIDKSDLKLISKNEVLIQINGYEKLGDRVPRITIERPVKSLILEKVHFSVQ